MFDFIWLLQMKNYAGQMLQMHTKETKCFGHYIVMQFN